MNDVKLTDFSADELQDLLTAVVMAKKIFKYTATPKENENLDLWQVQILNAISTVKMRDIPQQN